jgi:hypothetical protein
MALLPANLRATGGTNAPSPQQPPSWSRSSCAASASRCPSDWWGAWTAVAFVVAMSLRSSTVLRTCQRRVVRARPTAQRPDLRRGVVEYRARRRLSTAARSKLWAWVAVIPPADEATGFHWLLIRRRIGDGELAFYRCHAPTRVGLPALVRVAGTR